MFWFSGHEACRVLAPWPGAKNLQPPALEGEVFTTGPPGKFKLSFFWNGVNNSIPKQFQMWLGHKLWYEKAAQQICDED